MKTFKETLTESFLTEGIPPSTMYALVKDDVVVKKGNAKDMQRERKTLSKKNPSSKYRVWNSPNSKVGDKLKH